MNVDCRRREKSVARGRVLAVGVVLLAAGFAILGFGFRSTPITATGTAVPTMAQQAGLPANASAAPAEAQARARSVLAGLPLLFEPNLGQANLHPADPRAKFVARGSGYSLFLGSEGAILSLVSQTSENLRAAESVQMKLAGANPHAPVRASDPMPGRSNYLLGNEPARWKTAVPQFARVRYENVYPGIDLVFYGNQGRLEYDFQVAPGSDPSQAELEFHGARQLQLQDGALLINTASRSIQLEAPQVYQEIAGRRQPVQGRFVLRGANRAGFEIGSYDRSRELVIDPILSFSTYFGGSGDEHSNFVAVDGSFNIYLTGSTTSPNLPAVGTFQTTLKGPQNVYVAKITPPLGSIVAALDYVTYLGGDGTDYPVGISVDGAGNAFVAGTTTSSNFPITPTTAYQTAPETTSPAGSPHVFVTELNSGPTPAPASTLNYSTYLSGNAADTASGMTIDALGDVFVTGTTTSNDMASTTDQFPATTLPQALPFQETPRSSIQFFVTKVNTNASRTGSIVYSTYFGGGTFQSATPVATGGGIAVDTAANIYFSGTTNFTYTGTSGTTDFPILNAYQPCLDQVPPTTIVNPPTCTYSTPATATDAFAAKLNPNANQGQQLQWSTYLGGTQSDSGNGIALGSGAANVYVVGTTNSQPFVSTGATYAAFQACLNNNPLTTTTTAPSCPAVTDPTTPTDAYVAKLSNPTNTTGTPVNVALSYFSYLGGANNEQGLAVTVDTAAGALITGWTQSPYTGVAGTFPVAPYPNSIQSNLNGPQDAFVARLNTGAVIGQTTTASWANYFGGSGTDSGTGIALDVNQNTYLAGETNSVDLPLNKPLSGFSSNSGGYDAFVTQFGTALSLSVQGVLTLGNNQSYISAGNPAQFTYTITNNGPDLASGITVTDNVDSNVTGVPLTNVSATSSSQSCGTVTSNGTISCPIPSLQAGSTATITISATPTSNSSGSSADFNGGTVQVMAPGNIVLAQTSVPAKMSDFTLSVGPTNQSVPVAGDTAVYQAQLTPHPLYGSNVTLSCTGLPTGAACNWAPNQTVVLQSSSGATATLSITTTPRPVVTPATFLFPRFLLAIGLMIPGLVLTAGMGGRRRRMAGVIMLFSVVVLLVFLPACSHSTTPVPPSGTPPGNYTITVTATSGSDSKSQAIGLSVP